MNLIAQSLFMTAVVSIVLSGCGGPSRTISETTREFPKCDVAQGVIALEYLRCGRGHLCDDSSGTWSGRAFGFIGGSPADHFARAKGVEGNTFSGLRGGHRKLTGMLVTALRETGCFEAVDLDSSEKDQGSNWKIGGDVNKIVAWADAALPSGHGLYSATHRTKQTANLDISINIKKDGATDVIGKRKFSVSAKRVGVVQASTDRFDWSRKKDVDGFGDTAMQDVATEITTQAAVFITESLAGTRITKRVIPAAALPNAISN